MAHTDPENIIPQKPPPPPRREGDPAERPAVDPQAPTEPAQPQRPTEAPFEAPPQQPIAPRVAGPASSRRLSSRKPSGHIVVPSIEIDPVIISRTAQRSRMGSDPALTLIDFPTRARPAANAR